MTKHSLKLTKREVTGTGKLNALRAQGYMPGVIYGNHLDSSINVQAKISDVRALLAETDTDSILVNVDLDGEQHLCLVKDVQRNFLTDTTTHMDFQAVLPETVVKTKVYVKLNGTPAGVAMGGQVNQIIYEIPVKCAVKDIPAVLEADIADVKLNETVRLSRIQFPENVTTPFNSTVVIASVVKL